MEDAIKKPIAFLALAENRLGRLMIFHTPLSLSAPPSQDELADGLTKVFFVCLPACHLNAPTPIMMTISRDENESNIASLH